MSINTIPVESVTFAQFIQRWAEERWQVDDFHTVGAYGDGTRVIVRIKGELKAYNLTDLLALIIRTGTQSQTIAANLGSVTTNVALSPALSGVTTDYRIVAVIQDNATSIGNTRAVAVYPRLTTLSNLRLVAFRSPIVIGANSLDTDSVDVTITNPHSHLGPTIVVNLGNIGAAALTFDTFWAIWKP